VCVITGRSIVEKMLLNMGLIFFLPISLVMISLQKAGSFLSFSLPFDLRDGECVL
jgi:hypothetical protein